MTVYINTKVKRVLQVNFLPLDEGGEYIAKVEGWHNPDVLAAQYITDIYKVSRRMYRYEIVRDVEINDLPTSRTMKEWLTYLEVTALVSDGTIDEVWMFIPPAQNMYKSVMGGPGAFWSTGPALADTDDSLRRFFVMAYDYSRGVDDMLENLVHRAEAVMYEVYKMHPPRKNMWEQFTRTELKNPGHAAVGTAHLAPNSEKDFDYGNVRQVTSSCEDWLNNYPKLQGVFTHVDTTEWGNGDNRLHKLWWLKHLPHGVRFTDGVYNNWWHYIMTPDWVKGQEKPPSG